jgi:hypothetical protein
MESRMFLKRIKGKTSLAKGKTKKNQRMFRPLVGLAKEARSMQTNNFLLVDSFGPEEVAAQ